MNQQSAQGLASLGRGPDSMLVHMAPGEVKSLQQLAMAHGGSLTINPETGLPEAGFLSSLLPMLIGGGLSIASGGALTPLMAAMMTGGGYAAATGSLKKGLMAGLGAYGGAGLGSALAGAGGANLAAAGGVNAANLAGPAVPPIEAFNPSNLAGSSSPGMFGNAAANFSKAGAGITGLGSEAGRNAFMTQVGGGKGLMQAGAMAAAPMLTETTTKQPEIKTDANMGQRYQFNAGAQTPTPIPDVPEYGNQGQNFGKERQYFNPMYRPIDDEAARKQYGFATGGPIEDMSNANNMAAYMGRDKFAEGGEVGGYTYDPVTQMYTKKGGEEATMVSPIDETSGASGSSAGDSYNDPNPGWSGKTGAERAAFYGENPNFGAVTRGLQDVFSLTTLGMAQKALDPDLGMRSRAETYGLNPDLASYGGASFAEQKSINDALAAQTARDTVDRDQGAAVGADMGYAGPSGSDPASDSGRDHGNSGSAPGGGAAAGGLMALAQGGISHLGDYSDGGRLLRGPGDGISDSIPAMIGKKQPARLADGEFVVPARIVSELGNGSTEAGARKLYAMMDRVQKARKKTVGKGRVAANSRAAKYLPA